MKKLALVWCGMAVAAITAFTQQPAVNWNVSMEPMKRFIENKSQFDGKGEIPGSEILFGVDHGSTQIFFTKNGMTFLLETKKPEKPEHERVKEEKLKELGYVSMEKEFEGEDKTALAHMEWVGANSSATLTGLDETTDYFSYNTGEQGALKNISHIKSYQRLLYKNLYPGIDVEYAFHPVGGIKYKIIVHPGADVSQVKMRYSGAECRLDAIGNIRLATVFGDIVDNAPVTFYEGKENEPIASHYRLNAGTVSFELGNFNHRKTVVIDPWTVTPAMPTVNKVYNIKADSSGNAYIYGGDTPYRLQKYNAAGVLQWTYNTPWSAANQWFGGLAVDPSGNAFITSGTDATVSKINTNGGLVWSSASGGSFAEYWAPTFNCDYTQLLVGGTNLINVFAFQFMGAVYEINVNNGALLNTINVSGTLVGAPGNPPFVANEVRSMCYSPNGNYYFLTLDTIGSLTPALTIGYRDSSFYNLSYYLPYGQGGTGQGQNGICATKNLLYTTDGHTLHKRDINTGTILSTVVIPNGSKEVNSGIAADSCGNVYVGAVAKVHKYDGNLNLLASANAPAEVYDVAVSKTGEVVACGNGFALSVNMGACEPQRPVCIVPFNAAISKTDVQCYGECNGTATATPTNGNAPYTYFWSNGQTVQTATGLCAGTYSVTVGDAANREFIGSVVIENHQPVIVSVSSFNASCGTSVVATPSGGVSPFSFLWSTGDTLAGLNELATGTYSVTATDANGCTGVNSVNVTQTVGFSLAQTVINAACGACDGSATVTPDSTANPPFRYLWSNGDTTQTATNLCAGAYTVTVTESPASGGTVFWNEDFTNGGTGWTLNINGPGTNAANANSWVINNNLSACTQCPAAGSGGNYLHITCTGFPACASDPGSCIYDKGVPIFSNAATDKYVTSPNISTLGKTGVTLSFGYMSDGEANDYGLVRLSDDGGATWTDLPTKYFGVFTCTQASIPLPAQYENIAALRIGFRWVNDNNITGNDPPFMIDDIELSSAGSTTACASVAVVNVSNTNAPVVSLISKNDVTCNAAGDGAINISVSGGNPPYSYSWTGGAVTEDISGLDGGAYTITVTDDTGCIGLSTINIAEPSALLVSAVVTNAGCSPTGMIDLTANGGTPPLAYSWTNGATTEDLNNVASGTYSVTVTDSNLCAKTAGYTITSSGSPVINLLADDVSCHGLADGSVTSNVAGGNPPYQFAWNTGATTASLANISGGTYSVTVRDGNNCTISQTATVNEPTLLTATASITTVLCQGGNNGGIKLNPAGGTAPYTAQWSHGATGLSLTALAPGIYIATVTDANGCTLDTAIDLSSASIYQVNAVPVNSSCGGGADGSITANIIDGTTPPYSFSWSTGATTATITNVVPGIYSVTVTDSLSCLRSDTAMVGEGNIVIEADVTDATCPTSADGSIGTTVSGGTVPYSYLWNTGATSSSLQNIRAGTYSVSVTDQNDCSGNKTILVLSDTTGMIECDTVVLYDIFSPNGDGVNDTWIIDGIEDYSISELKIFNRWGNVVFEASPYVNTFKGISDKGEALPSATYYYILKLNDANKTIYSGHLTLIR